MSQYVFKLSPHHLVNELSTLVGDIRESFQAHRDFHKFGHVELGRAVSLISDVEVFCSDKAVALGGISKNIPGAIYGTNPQQNNIIVVNRRLLDQDRWFIDGVVAHELGHIKLHANMKRPIFNKLFSIMNGDQLELEADDYAFDLGHDMLRVLKKCKQFGYRVERRIGHIRSRTF